MLLEGIVDSRYYIVDKTKAFALTPLLGGGETPGYFPMRGRLLARLKRQRGVEVPEETSGERGACPEGTEHDLTIIGIERASEDGQRIFYSAKLRYCSAEIVRAQPITAACEMMTKHSLPVLSTCSP